MNKILKLRIIEVHGTQADFAQAIGTHESLVSQVIRGRRKLNSIEQERWANNLGCKSEDLFVREEQVQ